MLHYKGRTILPLLISVLLLPLSCQNEKRNATLIENINVIDPLNGLSKNQSISIANGRIVSVQAYDPKKKKDYKTIVEGKDKYLIPGLWDAHVHFAYDEELAPSMLDLFILHGITSVRDTGGKLDFVKEWRESARSKPLTSPRVMIAGPLLDGMPNVYDGSDPSKPPLSIGLETEEEIEKAVNHLMENEVDLLKAYEMLEPAQLEAITEIAQKRGLKVTGHVPLSMSVQSAIEAGLNSIEHLRNIELSCVENHEELLDLRKKLLREGRSNPGGILRSRIHNAQREYAIENYDQKEADKVIEALIKNDVWQIPTLALIHSFVSRPYLRLDFQESFSLLPDSLEAAWKSRIEDIANTPPRDFSYVYSQWTSDMTLQMHKKGIPIMAGTDSPIFFLTPGLSLHEELYELVDSGLTPLEAIRAASHYPAKYFAMEKELGLVKEGFLADLLILDKNPLDNIRNTTSINTVIKNGNLIDSVKLQEIRDKLSIQ